jgi:DNA repair exonuclease SbcCD ATPase subunit
MFDDFEIDVPDVIADLAEHRKTISGKLVLLDDRKKKLVQVQQNLEQLKRDQQVLVQCSQILQDFYTAAQKASVKRVESFVTYCLKETFGDDAYEFRIKYETRRNQPEAEFVFVRKDEVGNEQEYDPKLACGGGCLDVAVTALRLAVIMTSPQRPRRILLLDEPFRYVSQNYRCNLIRLIEVLAADCQTQFVIVSHFDDLKDLGDAVNGKLIEL